MATAVPTAIPIAAQHSPKVSRDYYIDAVRGFAILLVVVGHAIQVTTTDASNLLLFKMICACQMPLFMVVSGFVSYFSLQKHPFRRYLWRKFHQLVVPFLAWYFLVHYLILHEYRTIGLKAFALRLVMSPDYGLWFLWVLFLCAIIAFVTVRVSPRTAIVNILVVALAAVGLKFTGIDILGSQSLAFLLPFFFLGYLLCAYRERLHRWHWVGATAAFLVFPLLIGDWNRHTSPDLLASLPMVPHVFHLLAQASFKFLMAFGGVALAFYVVRGLRTTAVFSRLAWLGTFTLDIYVIHNLYLEILQYRTPVAGEYNFYAIVVTVLCAMVLSLATSFYVIRQNRVAKFLLLGG